MNDSMNKSTGIPVGQRGDQPGNRPGGKPAQSPLQKYLPALLSAAGLVAFMILVPSYARKTASNLANQLVTTMLVIPPIFVMLGLLDVWVPREKMIAFMGPGSGLKGVLLAFFLGSAAAGPLYGAFPVAAVLMKKGASFSNILIFIGAWSTTKVPMFMFEVASLGFRFAMTRLLVDIPVIIFIALAMKKAIPKEEVDRLYRAAEAMD
ncbi:MAG: permease [Rectinemataceae bacterium]|nr:permease [Rectinemataceae bacterium]